MITERGLEPDRPRKRPIELRLLLLDRVRSVIGGDRIDRPVREAVAECITVLGRTEWRVHLQVGVVRLQIFVREGQVVRGHLRGHPDALGLRAANELDAPPARQVA
jgi:hypothetical protein